ncbi:MAG: hypothetical protein HQL58_13805, partial [Magnetococcales bacterium]|nr:hypothetical protein [Magnetococcales bacterium]
GGQSGGPTAELEGRLVLSPGNWHLVWINDSGDWAGGAGNILAFGTVGTVAGGSIPTPAPPAAPTGLDLAANDDSGRSNGDNLTKNATALTVSGFGKKGSTVTLFDDRNGNGQFDSGESLGTVSVTASTGAWNRDITLAAGVHIIRAVQKNGTSASTASDALMITVDTFAPSASSLPDLDADDDSGSSSNDNSTSTTRGLNFSGTGEVGATVTLFTDTNKNRKRESSEKALATMTVDDGGWWRTGDLALAIGAYSLCALQTDAAGNVSGGSSILTLSIAKTAKQATGLTLSD